MAFIVLYFIPEAMVRIFSSDPTLIAAGAHASRLVFWSMPIMGFVMLGTSSFISLGKAAQAFITAIARPALFLIPSVLILPRLLGLEGVFLSFPASDALTLALTILLLIPIFKEFVRASQAQKTGNPTPVPVPSINPPAIEPPQGGGPRP